MHAFSCQRLDILTARCASFRLAGEIPERDDGRRRQDPGVVPPPQRALLLHPSHRRAIPASVQGEHRQNRANDEGQYGGVPHRYKGVVRSMTVPAGEPFPGYTGAQVELFASGSSLTTRKRPGIASRFGRTKPSRTARRVSQGGVSTSKGGGRDRGAARLAPAVHEALPLPPVRGMPTAWEKPGCLPPRAVVVVSPRLSR